MATKRMVLGETQTLLTSDENTNFPCFFQMRNGRQYLSYSLGYHTVTERPFVRRSDDGGRTWELTEDPPPTFQFDDGALLYLGGRMYPNQFSTDLRYHGNPRAWLMGVMRSGDGGQTWEQGLFHLLFPYTTREFDNYSNIVPFELSSSHVDKGSVLLPDGTLLQVCVGNEKGHKHSCSMLIASSDQGQTWEYRGMPGPTQTRWGEGFNEAGIAYHPPSGDLVALMRPGGPLYGSRSSDLGYTWSAPEAVWDELYEYITPAMLCLDDGTLVATYGTRYSNLAGRGPKPGGVWLMHSEDGGRTWEEPVLVWDGPSCNNNRLWYLGGRRFRLLYSRTGFCLLETERQNNSICAVDVEVR